MSLDPALVLSIISTVLAGAAHARFHLKSRCCGQVVSLDLTPTIPIRSPPQTAEEEGTAKTGSKKCTFLSPSSEGVPPPSDVKVDGKP